MKNDSEQNWRGIGISTGIAIGPAYVIDQTGLPVPHGPRAAAGLPSGHAPGGKAPAFSKLEFGATV